MKKPIVLCIMDGFGINPEVRGNAIKAAKTPNLTRLFAENPYTTIGASGLDVGLPDGHRRRPRGVPDAGAHHQIDPRRRLF